MPAKTSSPDFTQALGSEVADKRIDILRRLGEVGSISQAARSAGVSYKAAWQALETLSNLAGTPLIEKVVGGSGGGGAQLTQAGQQVLQGAEKLAQARSTVLAVLQKNTLSDNKAPNLQGLGLRTSMRNNLPCT
ncbi:MAG: LysR family transcriptional regulator, partial [Limnohabitans sp.]|nr:LysR family transcriptional regulator [Limnohabitans sp.]